MAKIIIDSVLILCRVYVAFIAASGFLFAQMFFGHFDWFASIAGVFGLISGILGGAFFTVSRLRARIILVWNAERGQVLYFNIDMKYA